MDWATASPSSSDTSARNVTSNPVFCLGRPCLGGRRWRRRRAWLLLGVVCWTAIVFTALSWLDGSREDHRGRAARHCGTPTGDRLPRNCCRGPTVVSHICDGSAPALRMCEVAQPRGPASRSRPRVRRAATAFLRGDPRAAYAGDVGQGEGVRGTGQVDAPGGTKSEVGIGFPMLTREVICQPDEILFGCDAGEVLDGAFAAGVVRTRLCTQPAGESTHAIGFLPPLRRLPASSLMKKSAALALIVNIESYSSSSVSTMGGGFMASAPVRWRRR